MDLTLFPSDTRDRIAALERVEQAILYLKALIGPPTNKGEFLNCLNHLRVVPSAWTFKSLGPVLDSLRARGLLDEELACPPALLHPLAVAALAAPGGTARVDAIAAHLPFGGKQYWDTARLESQAMRWLRLTVYLNDLSTHKTVSDLAGGQGRAARAMVDRYFADTDIGWDWLRSRHVEFQTDILLAKSNHWAATGAPPPGYADLISHLRGDPAALAVGYTQVADYMALRGDLAGLRALLDAVPPGVSPDVPAAFHAIHTLLSGDAVAAAPLFSEAVRLFRRATKRRKAELPGYAGLLHLCALIAADDPTFYPAVEAATSGHSMSLGHFALAALLDLARNQTEAARKVVNWGLITAAQMRQSSPFSTGLLAVTAVQTSPDAARPHAKHWAALFNQVADTMPLAAGILAEALEKVAGQPKPYTAYLTRPDRQVRLRFLGMLAAKEPWERALDSLQTLLAPPKTAAPVAAAAGKEKRLVWLVDADEWTIQPVEQVRQTRGWSAGRPVALKRLRQGDAGLDYIDDLDRRAIATIHHSTDGWNSYGQDRYEFRPVETLPALVGHPRVFDMAHPGQAVELVLGRAELVLSKTRVGYRLALSHPARRAGVQIEVEAPGRWQVVLVDQTAVAAAAILGDDGIRVPATGRDRLTTLARLHLPQLPLRVDAAEFDDANAVDGDPQPVLRLTPAGTGLKVSLVVRPLGAAGPHFLPGVGGRQVRVAGQVVRRDLAAEQAQAKRLGESCPSLAGDGPEWLLDTLYASLELLAELKALPTPPVMEWPEGETLTLRGTVAASHFKATVKGGGTGAEEWFALGGKVELDNSLVLELKDLLARLAGMQGRFLPLDDGGFLMIDQHFRQQLERLNRLGDGLKISKVGGAAVRDLLDGAGSLKADAAWKDFTRRLDEAGTWRPQIPAGFVADMRDYQTDGFAWMSRLARWGAGALLADDMGLGKTVQAIAVMVDKGRDGPILVVAPTSVCGNWQAELARFAPGLSVHRLDDSDDRAATIKTLKAGDVLIVSYGLLAREEERLTAIPWAMAVLDEAQAIKNADTQRARAALKLNAGFRLALTGTPVENDLDELWSLFRFVNPGLLGGREAFSRRFGIPIATVGDANAKASLKALVRPFLLRRTKAAVLAELPARTEQTLLIERGPEEQAFYEALRRTALERLDEVDGERTRLHILAEITRLRQACCHPSLAVTGKAAGLDLPSAKLDAFMELVAELRDGGHRALVFSQFTGHLAKVRAALDEAGVGYLLLDGSTPAREREKRVAAFQAGEGDLFLISLKAGGFGLNLTAADYVIHLDPWWNPAVEEQASDRAHRIGQQRPVTIYRLIIKDSIEEGILALHSRKRDLADALLDGADAAGRLSQEDLLNLIRGG